MAFLWVKVNLYLIFLLRNCMFDSEKINAKDTIFFTTVNMVCYNWNNVTLTYG